MVDAAFVVLLLVKIAEDEEQECCRIFNRPHYIMNIVGDMFLLENQLPFFILEDLFDKIEIEIEINSSSQEEADEGGKGQEDEEETREGGGGEGKGKGDFIFMEPVCRFVNSRQDIGAKGYDPKMIKNRKIEHFLDCLCVCHLSSKKHSRVKEEREELQIPSLMLTATKLHQAGVRFAEHTSTHLLDIKFEDGMLSIPHFSVGDYTETFYRNLLAFEQCHYLRDSPFTAYFHFMDQLINTPEDIELLVECGIINSTASDRLRAANIFNGLGPGLLSPGESHYGHRREQLLTYYKVPWHKWKAALRQNYFNTPWAGISVIAAVILLVLTVVQTVFSVIS
ncbi:putative UPF0481 protein At3g02645 isoform X1 [Punica granatum]|uniref:UPF0481 protein At3g02645 isoform X1 n=2 Tax=Punica granatum TaxID=22663 RepID=A0A6P8BMC7_PUNGR|nr:putative UPF0481 protein At3g02645 isoform X1 [Punica granatum]